MNLFILDKNPETAARIQCDKHIVKMTLESAQMLSTAHRVLDGTECKVPSKSGKRSIRHWTLDDEREDVLYKVAHLNHPCTVWTRTSNLNYQWHLIHFVALVDEYKFRYGKYHKTMDLLPHLVKLPKNIEKGPLTPFVQAFGEQNQHLLNDSDPIQAYREFYKTKKESFEMKWSKRPVPLWFKDPVAVKPTKVKKPRKAPVKTQVVEEISDGGTF